MRHTLVWPILYVFKPQPSNPYLTHKTAEQTAPLAPLDTRDLRRPTLHLYYSLYWYASLPPPPPCLCRNAPSGQARATGFTMLPLSHRHARLRVHPPAA